MTKEKVVVKKNTSEHLAPGGRGWHEVPGEGVLNKEHFIGTPSSPLRGTSPARGEVNGGFTLIELLVVVLIIGILAAVAVPQYKLAVEKARALELISAVNAVHKAEELYYLANGTYTSNLTKLDLEIDVSYLRYLSVGIGDNPYVEGTAKNGLSYVYYQDHAQSAVYRGRRECRTPLTDSDTLQKVCASLTRKTTRYSIESYHAWLF